MGCSGGLWIAQFQRKCTNTASCKPHRARKLVCSLASVLQAASCNPLFCVKPGAGDLRLAVALVSVPASTTINTHVVSARPGDTSLSSSSAPSSLGSRLT